jgi:hypothetical protein
VNKKAIEIVTDGIGATLIFTPDGGDTIVFHSGSGGTNAGTAVNLSAYFDANTHAKTAHVVWQHGTDALFGNLGGGWWTRKDAAAVDAHVQSHRPGSVIAWIHDNLGGSNKFGTVGCSMGTMATLSPVLWGPLDAKLDYQMVMGGSAFWDVNATCGRTPAYTIGHCDVSAARCGSDSDCSGGTDHCRFPTDPVTGEFSVVINYLYQTAGDPTQACFPLPDPTAQPNPAFDRSSFNRVAHHFGLGHRVHFVTDEDGPLSLPPGTKAADQHVMEGNTLYALEAITLATSSTLAPLWTDFDQHYHCDSFGKDPSLTAWTVSTIQREMMIQ